jgi:hypothetical protein
MAEALSRLIPNADCRVILVIRHRHVIVWNQRSLRRTLQRYFAYYQGCRTHLSLEKDSPASRSVEPPARGHVVEIPQVGGLHHLYTRQAA